MKSKTWKLLLTAGLCLPLSLQASVDTVLSLDLTCYVQDKILASGGVDVGKVGVLRLNAKQLLILASRQLGVKYPGGTQLLVALDGTISAVDSKGNVVSDLSKLYHVERNVKNRLFDGKSNQTTGQENSRDYYPITFTINLNDLKCRVSGLAIGNLDVSAPNKYGTQHISGNSSSAVNGKGSSNAELAYYNGKLSLSTRGEVIQEK
jgi:hypothetical protein